MEWTRKKDHLLNILGSRLRNLSSSRNRTYLTLDSRLRIPILVNTIHVTQASTQTLSVNFNKNETKKSNHRSFFLDEESRSNGNIRRHRHRKYQHRFNKCLVELLEKYPPLPAHEYLKEENDQSKKSSSYYSSISTNSSIWSKLFQSRDDLARLNQTLEDLDKRLEYLSSNICSKCRREKDCLILN